MNARRKALADQRKQLGPTRKSLLDINADFVTSACDSVWQFSSMFFELRFRQSGMNPIRLVKMLKGKGACNCSRKDCFQRLETQADCLAEFIQCFYALSKPDQDEFVPCSKQHACGIHSCSELMIDFSAKIHQQNDDGGQGPRAGRRNYSILGMPVGLECLANVLGIGKKRLLKASKGIVDMRFVGGILQPSPKTHSIDRFLFDLHGSVAETLPTQHLVRICCFEL